MGQIKVISNKTPDDYNGANRRILTADAFEEHSAIVQGTVLNENTGDRSGKPNQVFNRTLFVVPENTSAYIYSATGIEHVITRPGFYVYKDLQEDAQDEKDTIVSFLGFAIKSNNTAAPKQLNRYLAYLNQRPIHDIKWGTKGPRIYRDVYYGKDLEFYAYGNFSIAVTEPEHFIRSFVTSKTGTLSFDDPEIRARLLNEFLPSFTIAINALSQKYRITHTGSYAEVLTDQIRADAANVGMWWQSYGIDLQKVDIEHLELAEESRQLVHKMTATYEEFVSDPSVQTRSLEDIKLQVEIVKGLKELLDDGALTEEEYEFKKKEVMGFNRQPRRFTPKHQKQD